MLKMEIAILIVAAFAAGVCGTFCQVGAKEGYKGFALMAGLWAIAMLGLVAYWFVHLT